MSKSIKITDETYEELRALQGPRETYSQVILRLLAIIKPLQEAKDILGPGYHLSERPKEEVK